MEDANKLITAFFMIIIGVVLIGSIATSTNQVTSPNAVVDEQLNIGSARIGNGTAGINQSVNFSLANLGMADLGGWVANSVFITNASGSDMAGNYSVDYNTDRITFLNTTFMSIGGGSSNFGNITLADYKYYQSSYVTQSWARSVLNTNVGMFGLAIMLIGVGLAYSTLKDKF